MHDDSPDPDYHFIAASSCTSVTVLHSSVCHKLSAVSAVIVSVMCVCRACSFGRRPRPTKKRKSCDNLVDLEAWAAAEQASQQLAYQQCFWNA